MKVYIVNGRPGSGKTTFENYCFALNPVYVRLFSSIQPVKEIAEKCGWKGAKEPKDRKFLADLKQLLIEYNNFPFNQVVSYIELQKRWFENRDYDSNNLIFFIDVREPSEIQKLRDKYGAQAILIQRALSAPEANTADCEENFNPDLYDMIIANNGTLEQLEAQAREFMKDKRYK